MVSWVFIHEAKRQKKSTTSHGSAADSDVKDVICAKELLIVGILNRLDTSLN